MPTDHETYAEERVGTNRIEVWRASEDAPWFVTVLPDIPRGVSSHEGHTYTPGEPFLPDDYPRGDDPAALLAWARGLVRSRG